VSEHILVVDDVDELRTSLKNVLTKLEYNVSEASDAAHVMALLKESSRGKFVPDLILLDVRLPDVKGLEFLEQLKDLLPEVPIIVMTGYGTVSQSVEAMRKGASDYVLKPFNVDELILRIQKTLETVRLRDHVGYLAEQVEVERACVWGANEMMKKVRQRLEMVAKSPSTTVMICGETGTGKEVIARAVHHLSERRESPFVAINATALSTELLESELFGHEEGAFTGAIKSKKGLFEVATKGTLFLDEIGDMPTGMQAKLLRALEERSIRRVGGTTTIDVDIRLIVATNKDLEEKVKSGDFREDLFYRLNVVPIKLPSLRERKDDIESLAVHFINVFNAQFRRQVTKIAPRALQAMLTYSWPGNIRELRNMIERAMLLECDSGILKRDHLMFDGVVSRKTAGKKKIRIGEALPLEVIEREHIEGVLQAFGGNKNQAAHTLGIDRTTLYNKIRKYEIS
jgi:two-component system, NtrC family, response regulator AtoC